MCRYSSRPANVSTLFGRQAHISFTSRTLACSNDGDAAAAGARQVVSVDPTADQRSLNVINPGVSRSERPKSSSSAPPSLASLVARQNNIGVPPRLLNRLSEPPYL